jgi:hypothetical protein
MSVDPKKPAERIATLANAVAAHRSNVSQIRNSQPQLEPWMGDDARSAARGAHTLQQMEQEEKANVEFRQKAWTAAQSTVGEWKSAVQKAQAAVKSASVNSRKQIDPQEFDSARLEVRHELEHRSGNTGYGARALELIAQYQDREDWAALKALRYEAGEHLDRIVANGMHGTDGALASQARHQLRGMQLPGESEVAQAESNLAEIRGQRDGLVNTVREVAREAGGVPEMWTSELGLGARSADPSAATAISSAPTITATAGGVVVDGSWGV